MSSARSIGSEVAQQAGEVHFGVSGLEAAFERGRDPALRRWGANALAKEIGIATEVLRRGERDRVDALLDKNLAGDRKPGDPRRERSDEIVERRGGQGSIDPAVTFGQLRVVILRAQHHLERAGPADEAREVLDPARAGELTQCRLRLAENRRLPRRK